MKLYLDTSSLFKLYHTKAGTQVVDSIFAENNPTAIFISEIALIEFTSALFKKVRSKELNNINATLLINLFEVDCKKYNIVPVNTKSFLSAKALLIKYAVEGPPNIGCAAISLSS